MLTNTKCRKAAPEARPYKLADAHGLFLFVAPTGLKSWRWKYRFDGKERGLVLGRYPETTLREAREIRDRLDRERRAGTDPKEALGRPDAPEGETFEQVARQWHERQKVRWRERHADRVLTSLENDAFPHIGAKPIAGIDAPTVLALLRRVEARGAHDQAHRLRQRLDAVFSMAIGAGLATSNPAAMVGRALTPAVHGRRPAVRTIAEARAAVQAVDGSTANVVVKLALRLLALTATRSEAVRFAGWHEFERLDDPERAQWRIPGAHMKGQRAQRADPDFEFIVPLAPQAVATIEAVRALTGNAPFVFASLAAVDRPLSDNTLSAVYRRLAAWHGRHVPHGWRSTFSTVLNEWAVDHGKPGDGAVIDLMLAHKRPGVEGIYNRAAYMPRRRELARIWADMLLEGAIEPGALLGAP